MAGPLRTPHLPATEPASVTPPGNDNEPLIERTTLIVDSMVCGTCMIAVEEALQRESGVRSARVNLTTKRVAVAFDPTRVSRERLMGVLENAGFPAAELIESRAAADDARDRDFLRRLGVAGFAAGNIMLLSVSVWAGTASDMGQAVQDLFHWLSALIALPAVAYAGQPFFLSAARALRARRLNMDVPITLGVLLAAGMSLYQTIRGSEQVYFDAAVTLLFFLLVGRFLDQRMRTRAQGAAANLLGLKAAMATILRLDGTSERVSARTIRPGDRMLIGAGERLAADGCIVTGISEIEESLITGESVPRRVAPGDQVYAGTVNASGQLVVEATATDQSTLLAEIGRLMEAAEQGRGRYVRLADRMARLYAPAVHLLGAATFAGWLIAGAGWETALTYAIAVLIITCPCALALAVPAVQVAATSRLMSRGIIVKSADGLERLAEIDHVVLDKTGTLSLGEPRLVDAERITDATLAGAAALAAASRHPYARAVLRHAGERGLPVAAAESVVEEPGQGLRNLTPAGEARLGSAAWLGIEGSDEATLWYRPAGGAAIPLVLEDALRPDAAETVRKLTGAGLPVELLSGDRQASVAAAAAAAGIAQLRAAQKPADKIARLAALAAEGRKVLMVGDGLNDAPALAAGHASLSPATAADISQAAADAVFQGQRLAAVAETIAVARETRRMALQNFAIALGYNVVFVPLAVAGLVTPLIAAVAMSASSIAVTANAVRLRSRQLDLARGAAAS
ncbi:MAG: heavy metal translocating P-type ATPase [Pseudomonadota bacterium]